jgi:restriction endonuclease Mrr
MVLRDISGQVERIVYMLEQLDAEYTKLEAALNTYELPSTNRSLALNGIRHKVAWILGVLTWLEKIPGDDRRQRAASAEPRHPVARLDALHRLSPSAFERIVADLLKAQGYEGVEIGGGANDRGVDILCRDTDGSLIAVQCKRYDPNKPSGRVGAPVVQLLSAMALQRHAHRGILVTTATFTDSARKQAYDFDIELIDGEALIEQLSAHPCLLSSMPMR